MKRPPSLHYLDEEKKSDVAVTSVPGTVTYRRSGILSKTKTKDIGIVFYENFICFNKIKKNGRKASKPELIVDLLQCSEVEIFQDENVLSLLSHKNSANDARNVRITFQKREDVDNVIGHLQNVIPKERTMRKKNSHEKAGGARRDSLIILDLSNLGTAEVDTRKLREASRAGRKSILGRLYSNDKDSGKFLKHVPSRHEVSMTNIEDLDVANQPPTEEMKAKREAYSNSSKSIGSSKRGSPSSRKRGSPSGSKRGSPSGSKRGSPSGSKRGSPSGSKRGSPSGSKRGSPSGSKRGTPKADKRKS